MKNKLIKFIIAVFVLCFCLTPFGMASASTEVYLGGIPAGFSLNTRGVTVVGITDVNTANGKVSPGKEAGLKVGDIILNIGDYEINNSKDIALAVADGKAAMLTYTRAGEKLQTVIKPEKDALGKYKLGLFIRNFISGIGTLTYVKGNEFTSLGHPILDENENMIEIIDGNLLNCTIMGVIKGERGKAGELKGVFLKNAPFATAEANTKTGIIGTMKEGEIERLGLRKVEIGEAKVGSATVYTTVSGSEPKEYSMSIVKVDKDEKDNKNLVIKITDDELLSITGGIVQGMSGSPILQDGKIVGAVTHVFIHDPERGFGVAVQNIEN